MVGLQTSHRYGNATMLGPTSCWASATAGQTGTPAVSTRHRGRTFVHVDIEPTQMGRVFAPDSASSPMPGGARAVRRGRPGAKAAGTLPDRTAWAHECQERRYTMQRETNFDNVPIKPQRVYEEMNRAFGDDTRYVSTIGLYQIQPRSYCTSTSRALDHRRSGGALGWTVPARWALTADPEATVVALSGDYASSSCSRSSRSGRSSTSHSCTCW